VPPLNTRSPQNSTDCSGNHASTSLVVCAAVPMCFTVMRMSPACSAISSVKVRKGGSSGNWPQSGFSQKGRSLAGPNAIASARARSWATIVAPGNSALPNV
jgi:hypothetical protein